MKINTMDNTTIFQPKVSTLQRGNLHAAYATSANHSSTVHQKNGIQFPVVTPEPDMATIEVDTSVHGSNIPTRSHLAHEYVGHSSDEEVQFYDTSQEFCNPEKLPGLETFLNTDISPVPHRSSLTMSEGQNQVEQDLLFKMSYQTPEKDKNSLSYATLKFEKLLQTLATLPVLQQVQLLTSMLNSAQDISNTLQIERELERATQNHVSDEVLSLQDYQLLDTLSNNDHVPYIGAITTSNPTNGSSDVV